MLNKIRNANFSFNKYWLISGTILFGVVLAFLVVDIYNKTLEDEKTNHQKRQMEMVKSTAKGIDYLIKNLVNDMRFLGSYPDIKKLQPATLSFLEFYLRHQEPGIVHTVFITDSKGNIQYTAGENFPRKAEQYAKAAIDNGAMQKEFIITPVTGDTGTGNRNNLYFQLLLPVFSETKAASPVIAGYLGYLINFSVLIDQFIKPLKLTKDDLAWVIDGDGRLIYHPAHPEMINNSTKRTRAECFTCHTSFEAQNIIIASGKPAAGEYEVLLNAIPKIMIYYPLSIQTVKWVIVISTPVPKVTEGLREKFKVFFILGFIILGVLVSFGGLLYVVNARRIRAEEARRTIEQIQEYRDQINQSSRLASIGELVDTVAHEINTPAGIIAAHTDALLLAGSKTGNITPTLELIKKQTKRISDYTSGLLNYSKRIAFNPEPVDLRDLINECIFLLAHRYKPKFIHIHKEYANDLPKIFADVRQLEQVFINLLNNSIDAITSNGNIIIRAARETTEYGESAMITIEDTGTGISNEAINKIFIPFFSTKPNHQGTGLGLSIVKAIVQRHHGEIKISSRQDIGTTVTLTIPVQPDNKRPLSRN